MSDDPGGHTIYAESLSHPERTYAAGRRCPGCGAFLRRTNPGPLCDPCGERPVSRQSSTRGASASDHGSVVTTATQAPRTNGGASSSSPGPLLKTPTAQLAVNGGPQHPAKRKAGGHGPTLEDEVVFLLPPPESEPAA